MVFLLEFFSGSMQKENCIESTFAKEDVTFEIPLRPQSLHEFLGQEELRSRLDVFIGAAKQRREPLGQQYVWK